MDFGEILRKYRTERKMTLRQLGEKAGMDYVALNKIERGYRMPPPLERIMALSDALDLDWDQFEQLLDAASVSTKTTPARFSFEEVQRIKESRSARAFFTRREPRKEE